MSIDKQESDETLGHKQPDPPISTTESEKEAVSANQTMTSTEQQAEDSKMAANKTRRDDENEKMKDDAQINKEDTNNYAPTINKSSSSSAVDDAPPLSTEMGKLEAPAAAAVAASTATNKSNITTASISTTTATTFQDMDAGEAPSSTTADSKSDADVFRIHSTGATNGNSKASSTVIGDTTKATSVEVFAKLNPAAAAAAAAALPYNSATAASTDSKAKATQTFPPDNVEKSSSSAAASAKNIINNSENTTKPAAHATTANAVATSEPASSSSSVVDKNDNNQGEWTEVGATNKVLLTGAELSAKTAKNRKKRDRKKKAKLMSAQGEFNATKVSATIQDDRVPTPATSKTKKEATPQPLKQHQQQVHVGEDVTAMSNTISRFINETGKDATFEEVATIPDKDKIVGTDDSTNTAPKTSPLDGVAQKKNSAKVTVEAEPARKDSPKSSDHSGVSVTRVHRVGTVVVAPSSQTSIQKEEVRAPATGAVQIGMDPEEEDEWETVEVKPRGNRKKPVQAAPLQQSSAAANTSQHGGRKKKRKSKESRMRVQNGKMVRDILSSVLDTVDNEVKRRQQRLRDFRNATSPGAPPPVAWNGGNRAAGLPGGVTKEMTAPSVVAGRQVVSAAHKVASRISQKIDGKQGGTKMVVPSASTSIPGRMVAKTNASPLKPSREKGSGADQRTATTIPETVSAVSESRRVQPIAGREIVRSDSSSCESDENPPKDRFLTQTNADTAASPAPPLPTLLSPGNTNSASSSVASSLEAPHASHSHRHSSSTNENDVGYHLLDVCDRLTRDMHVFMARRAAALFQRRRERGFLLAALQNSVSSIWAGHSHVELYGSCATMLDLPSSDLDVVVCGLDQLHVASVSPKVQKASVQPEVKSGKSAKITPDKVNSEIQMGHLHHAVLPFVPMQKNSDRVMRLAAELERHPWAVLVKAIPTASVPVVKVLADPSRLPGAIPATVIDGEEWMMQQQSAADQSASGVPAGVTLAPNESSPVGEAPLGNDSAYQTPIASPVWRGADLDNGLLKLDITFQGPEHGGIGSTEFSARVVQNVCDETGQMPEHTAFVQVILVVKELLAQRRLNEPFSGGLSSYSLLLLVLAVLGERKVIEEELDRVEKQRRVVAAGGGNSLPAGSSADKSDKSSVPQKGKQQKGETMLAQATNAASGIKGKVKSAQSVQYDCNSNQVPKSVPVAQRDATKRASQGSQQKANHDHKGNLQKKSIDQGADKHQTENKATKDVSVGSWASIAMGKNEGPPKNPASNEKHEKISDINAAMTTSKKSGSFADAARAAQAKAAANAMTPSTQHTAAVKLSNTPTTKPANGQNARQANKEQASIVFTKTQDTAKDSSQLQSNSNGEVKRTNETPNNTSDRKIEADEKTSKFNNYSSQPSEPMTSSNPAAFPQGFNDVIEVLCSGETTPGKLLMHFLLFYGQYFDAQATAIDISGKHHREIPTQSPPYIHLSPYIQRRSGGTIDPVTGIFTVDPIVVYDPLEGAENNNVARRCFLWGNVKWVFAQSFMTLSSAVERNLTPPGTPVSGAKENAKGGAVSTKSMLAAKSSQATADETREQTAWNGPYNSGEKIDIFDPSSPLLELLLSF